MRQIPLAFIAALFIFTSCTKKSQKFTVKQINKNGFSSLSYEPKIAFTEVSDSTYYYFTAEDNIKVFSAEISKGDIIARTEYYNVRVMLREYLNIADRKFELLLRTFSADFKIIDTIVIGSTLEENMCEGVFDGIDTITRTCNGKKEIIKVNELGKFIIQE